MILASALLLSGCTGISHLKPGEKLLYSQEIKAPKHIDEEAARELYLKRSNRKLFGVLPIHYLVGPYYTGKKRYKKEDFIQKKEAIEKKYNEKIAELSEEQTKKINNLRFKKQKKINRLNQKIENGNTLMQWGEPLTLFDSATVNGTVDQLEQYLSSKGYFQNKVDFKVKRRSQKIVEVDYILKPGQAYFLDSIFYQVNDEKVLRIIKANAEKSFLKTGDQYDQQKFVNERERIDLLLKDQGFYEFSRQYVEFNIDTSYSPSKKVAVQIAISDPANKESHHQFTVTEVNFVPDAGKTLPGETRKSRKNRGTTFYFFDDDYNLRILNQRVFIQPGNKYSRSKTFNTQRQLANLDAFKFVNINYDTTDGQFIANIYTSPLDRYQWSNEAGVNVTQGFPGPFYNMTLKKRNVFRGLETLDLSGRFGFEGVASATSDQNVYKSTEAGVNLSLTFPQIILPLGEKTKIRLGKYNPKTKLLTGYSFTDRPEYRRTFLTFNGTYSMENKKTTQYSLSFANISIIDTVNTSPDFRVFLAEQQSSGNFSLVNAFYPSFVTSVIFGITWNPNDYASYEKNSIFIRALVESGGTIWNFVEPNFVTKRNLQYFQYLRFNVDFRRHRVLDKNSVLAYRVNTGVSWAYGPNQSVPYEKFFFAGGSYGIRAWSPRRLGPGSFKPNLSDDPSTNGLFDYSIEKPAEILIEGSIELRKKIFGFVEGALFVDAGNVWSFRQWSKQIEGVEVPNGNSKFKWNQFLKEIAVGTGFGLRFDFTFLILRLDVGIKAYDPARDPGDRFVLDRIKFWSPYTNNREPVIYNIGIGYPF